LVDMTRRAILSEGRGLRARKNGAGRKPRHVTVTGSLARAWWQKNATFGLASCPPLRACGARPSAGLVIRARMALRGKSGITRKAFLAGVRSLPLRDLKGRVRNRWPEGKNISAASGVVMPGVGGDRGPDEKAKMRLTKENEGRGGEGA
jgi:hypothetical protein